MGLLSVGMSSTCGESDRELSSLLDRESDSFPSRDFLKSVASLPLPVLLPKLRTEQSSSPQFKPYSNYTPNQFSLSDMTFDAAFHHDYDTQAPIVTVKSDKGDDRIDPVEMSVGPLQTARVRNRNVVAGCYILPLSTCSM